MDLSGLKALRDDRLDHLDAVERDLNQMLNTLRRQYDVDTHGIDSLLEVIGRWFSARNDVIEVENRINEWKVFDFSEKS